MMIPLGVQLWFMQSLLSWTHCFQPQTHEYPATSSAMFFPQYQMNTVVWHTGGKNQAHVILAI